MAAWRSSVRALSAACAPCGQASPALSAARHSVVRMSSTGAAAAASAGAPQPVTPALLKFNALLAGQHKNLAPEAAKFPRPTYAESAYGEDGVPTVLEPTAAKFINCMMYDGKKALAQSIFEKTLALIKTSELAKARTAAKGKEGELSTVDAMAVFRKALENVKPIIGLTPLRKGGAVHQIPTPLSPRRQMSLAIKWIIHAARERKGKNMEEKLYLELMDAYKNEGSVIRKKIELHKMAEANRANISIRYA